MAAMFSVWLRMQQSKNGYSEDCICGGHVSLGGGAYMAAMLVVIPRCIRFGHTANVATMQSRSVETYLTDKKTHPPRTLP